MELTRNGHLLKLEQINVQIGRNSNHELDLDKSIIVANTIIAIDGVPAITDRCERFSLAEVPLIKVLALKIAIEDIFGTQEFANKFETDQQIIPEPEPAVVENPPNYVEVINDAP